jgi:N-methylhydantoinase A
MAAERRDVMRSVMRNAADLDRAAISELCNELAERAGDAAERRWWAHARYAGQGHELDVPVTADDDGAAVAERFGRLHSARAGFTLERPVEIVSLRHAAFGAQREAKLAPAGNTSGPSRKGPAIIPLPDAAMRVEAGWSATALRMGGYMVERDA